MASGGLKWGFYQTSSKSWMEFISENRGARLGGKQLGVLLGIMNTKT